MASRSFKTEYAFLDMYKKLYAERYQNVPMINKYKEKWIVSSLIEDYGRDHIFECLEFYFKTGKPDHPLSWFFSNFDKLSNGMISQARDEQLRAERRQMTREIAKEYMNGV